MGERKTKTGDIDEGQMSKARKEEEEKVVNLEDLIERPARTPIRDLVNKVITIKDYEIVKGVRGEYVIMYTVEHGEVYTFSKVILDQLLRLGDTFKKGIMVRARVYKKGRYFILGPTQSQTR
jgi:hypothetical protein